MRFLGIDPGKSGGLVMIERTPLHVLEARRMEDLLYRVKRGRTDYLRRDILELLVAWNPDVIVLERQQPMVRKGVKEGMTASFATGFGFGVLAMACTAFNYIRGETNADRYAELIDVQPATWTRTMFRGVRGEGKHRAVIVAMERLPNLELRPGNCRKPHQGLADAACLALYGRTALAQLAQEE